MIKIFSGVVLICACTLLGNWFSMKLRRRTQLLERFVVSITKMKTLICFGGYDITYVLKECFGSNVFPSVVEFDENTFENVSAMWKEFISDIPTSEGLTKTDRNVLCGFGKCLGVTDTQGQINNCELYINLIEERLRDSRSDEISKCRLYRVLGFSLGSAVTLMVL